MATELAPGVAVKVTGGPHNGKKGTVRRVRTDALVTVRLRNNELVDVELYHLEKEN